VIENKEFFIRTIKKWYPDVSEDTIDNLLSEVICKMLEKNLIKKDTNFRQYIVKALINEIHRHYKDTKDLKKPHNRSKLRIDPNISVDETATWETNCVQEDEYTWKILRKYINQLDPQQRKVIILRFAFKMTHPESAKFLGIETKTSRYHLCIALKELRRVIL
jgi:RNA polymerase sigma factor (sigma-70 family)